METMEGQWMINSAGRKLGNNLLLLGAQIRAKTLCGSHLGKIHLKGSNYNDTRFIQKQNSGHRISVFKVEWCLFFYSLQVVTVC